MEKIENKINTYKLKAVSADLNRFDPLAKPDDFIEVSEWYNGEGFNIIINNRMFCLTYGEFDAIHYLIDSLKYSE